ncbi:hypothetical protein TNIN_260621 [Trichonephila inaurata madagascariensis]|uniref:Uncharacterized protein n=1 Tax=Trichonephila inaurata madagascariensis TaxID=2747483 RepID=A0A8X6Y534_9ARAC|nr:hypothetical protein TNIN_260621 [Trichonephila inaurata madagascariensis]
MGSRASNEGDGTRILRNTFLNKLRPGIFDFFSQKPLSAFFRAESFLLPTNADFFPLTTMAMFKGNPHGYGLFMLLSQTPGTQLLKGRSDHPHGAKFGKSYQS